MLVWVIYDISSNKDRNKIAKKCKNFGLTRVQLSVFFGNLPNNNIDEIALFSKELIDEETDAVFIIPVSEDDYGKSRILGKSFDSDLVTDKKKTLVL